ncbi:MAG TPA: hypothetical protein VHD58_05695 [Mycobacteriales bacterium]|nr:hypothetical protein [Mycobacteriales bacterium]
MRIRLILVMAASAVLAGCGTNSGDGPSVTTNGVTSLPSPSAVCTSLRVHQFCGPRDGSAASPTATAASPTPSCRPHHHARARRRRDCATATPAAGHTSR